MSLYLGIDLGSTTTKAVLLDEEERILGRGITNTRSDYRVATLVAENEARINARFTLLSRHADDAGLDPALLDTLLSEFTVESALFRLRRLRDFALEHEGTGAPRERLNEALDAVFDRIQRDLTENPEVSARIRNSFFRDIVGALFMAVAEEEAPRFSLDFEHLMAVYDAVILREENTVLDIDFAGTLKRCLAVTGLPPSARRASPPRSTGLPPSPSTSPTWWGPATAASGSPSGRTRSEARSSATAWAPTSSSPGPGPCSTSAARTPRPSRSTIAGSPPTSR